MRFNVINAVNNLENANNASVNAFFEATLQEIGCDIYVLINSS